MIETNYVERYFKTEVVASFVEVCYFGGFKYEEIFEFASFITGENINMSNIALYRNIIMDELEKQYPELERRIYLHEGDCLDEDIVNEFKDNYIKKYGKHMKIRSIKKYTIKKLKLR